MMFMWYQIAWHEKTNLQSWKLMMQSTDVHDHNPQFFIICDTHKHGPYTQSIYKAYMVHGLCVNSLEKLQL